MPRTKDEIHQEYHELFVEWEEQHQRLGKVVAYFGHGVSLACNAHFRT